MDRYQARAPEKGATGIGWGMLGLGVALAVTGIALYQGGTRNQVRHRPPDSAPGRTARRGFGRYAVTGRTVTINRPRRELYDYWRDFANLPRFMENVKDVAIAGDQARWTIAAPAGQEVKVETRIVQDREGEFIAWQSTDTSDIDTQGKVTFRDAPAGRGTEVEAIIAYVPPAGEIGRWIAKLFQREPGIQGRRELKRFKMLMEAGEIATSSNHRTM
jgi:uncharacterized membrane protein